MAPPLPITRVVLYKHGVAYLERRGGVTGDGILALDFKAKDMNDVLKSMTVLDLGGGAVSAVSYDSTQPVARLLEEATLRIPESGSLTALLGQVKGAQVRIRLGSEWLQGAVVGMEEMELAAGETTVQRPHLVLLIDGGLRTFDLVEVRELAFLDEAVKRDLEFYLQTVLSSYKKDTKRLSILTRGEAQRELFVSYVLEAPVWKTTYRLLIDPDQPPLLQGWAVVDNTGDEDWVGVELSLIAGLPVSFVHDLYQPRYVRRPVVEVQTETGVSPVVPEEAFGALEAEAEEAMAPGARAAPMARKSKRMATSPDFAPAPQAARTRELLSRTTDVRTVVREVGDLFEYRVENPVTVHRNQSALVPIVHRPLEGRRVLLWNRDTRERNPMACLELVNDTELTLEGGPVTVIEEGRYVGEAMLETLKPKDRRLVPFAVELSCVVSVDDQSEQGAVYRVRVNRGVLRAEFFRYRRTLVRIRNKAPRAQVLFLEHPKDARWELDGPLQPAEQTERFHRFRVELAAGAEVELKVAERSPGWTEHRLDNIGRDEVRVFLASRYIDARIAKTLKDVIGLRERLSEVATELKSLEQERAGMFKDQERLRQNLGALGGGGDQRQLADRLIQKLRDQEDRLESIDAASGKLTSEQVALEREVASRISGLSFEADLGEPPREASS